jgi:peptidoglycan LD-endopeptidase LytH
MLQKASQILASKQHTFMPIVQFNSQPPTLFKLDLSKNNTELHDFIMTDAKAMGDYIRVILDRNGCQFAFGGYDELRPMYGRSSHFGKTDEEPRRLHLGMDIWGPEGTGVFAPLGGMLHSFAFNGQFGDYGATIILQHQIDTLVFYTLYGHLNKASLDKLRSGQFFTVGEKLGSFGNVDENGGWAPHLHFQVILDLRHREGDYPGVCKLSERDFYLANCPDPNLILKLEEKMGSI